MSEFSISFSQVLFILENTDAPRAAAMSADGRVQVQHVMSARFRCLAYDAAFTPTEEVTLVLRRGGSGHVRAKTSTLGKARNTNKFTA